MSLGVPSRCGPLQGAALSSASKEQGLSWWRRNVK